eukprot:scaffold231277_cov33-Tisochrysis_lutea.AAC.3
MPPLPSLTGIVLPTPRAPSRRRAAQRPRRPSPRDGREEARGRAADGAAWRLARGGELTPCARLTLLPRPRATLERAGS